MTQSLVRRLREACTGGRTCECSYRLAADEIERLQDEASLRKLAEAERDGLLRQIEGYRADAERYRFIRDCRSIADEDLQVMWEWRGMDLDVVVDNAMRVQGKK